MPDRCCKGGSYNGHDHSCEQPGYKGPPPLPGHRGCPCGTHGGSFCWRDHTDRDSAEQQSSRRALARRKIVLNIGDQP